MVQTSDLVCVTGASGFIATQLVKALLEGGYRVRGTVRDPKKADVLRGLDGAKDRLELVAADLLDADSMQKAIAGTHVVMHTASPYVITVKDPQRDLVDPALKGTVKIKFTIAADGRVANAQDDGSQLASPEVIECVRAEIRKMTFPAPEGGTVTVVYPFEFEAKP